MEPSFKNILVSTDFSEQGSNAIKTAISLCKKHNAVLHLLYVTEERYIVTAPTPDVAVSAIIDDMEQEAKNQFFNEYESIKRMHNVQVQIHTPNGVPFVEICKSADEIPADLIVMGAHGVSGVKEFLIGTTAYNVIKHTTKPVLTVPANFEASEFKKILFPFRPVNGVKKKLEFVYSFLSNQEAAIHVAILCLENEEALLFNNKDELYEIITLLEKTKFSCTKELYICKNYATKVLALSEALEVDLIAINATLDYKWTEFFVGSYARQVVNHAKVPVLSIRYNTNFANKNSDQIEKEAEMN